MKHIIINIQSLIGESRRRHSEFKIFTKDA